MGVERDTRLPPSRVSRVPCSLSTRLKNLEKIAPVLDTSDIDRCLSHIEAF